MDDTELLVACCSSSDPLEKYVPDFTKPSDSVQQEVEHMIT